MGSGQQRPRAVLCTGNLHKVEELAALLPELDLVPLPQGSPSPPEIGETFLDNARIKALAGQVAFPHGWLLADDSGLVVDALDGAPGVRSARFAGADARDAENTTLLLQRLDELDLSDAQRSARFICVLVAIGPGGEEYVAEGVVEGRIARAPAGSTGFGYDPVFVPDGETLSFAQLGPDAKANCSHRARAARELALQLDGVLPRD